MILATTDRVVVKVDVERKNSHTFEDGTVIRLERGFNNFNNRETQPVNATVIDGSQIGVPDGAEVIIHHNSAHDVNRLFNFLPITEEASSNIKYFSIHKNEVFAYYNGIDWQPIGGFLFGLRVFKPYEGFIEGIQPSIIKNTLYVTHGTLKGKVVRTVKNADYEMVFQGLNGVEQRIIRFRHYPNEENLREEVLFIDEYMTKDLKKGKLIVGLTPTDAKTIQPCQKK